MKIKELVKKGLVLGLLLALTSVFVSCGGGGSSSGETYYSVKYKTYILVDESAEITKSDIDEMVDAGFEESLDFSINGFNIVLTDDGFAKFLDIMSEIMSEEASEEAGIEVTLTAVAIVVYNGKMLMPLTSEMLAYYGSQLTEGTDYTQDGEVIVLTAAGYDKITQEEN